jgi:type III secretion system YscD/HrpQ family protein
MSVVVAKELRVLAGPQAGCSLALGAGTFCAGADESCDVVLEGLGQGLIAFALYVGHHALALEALIDGVSVEGQPVRGLRELHPTQVFAFRQWRFAVDDPLASWPQGAETPVDPDTADAPASADELSAQSEDPAQGSTTAPPQDAPDETAPVGSEQAGLPAEAAATAVTRRWRVPFWVCGLIGTAAFLGLGMVALVASLAPAKAAPVADTGQQMALALEHIAKSVRDGEVTFERLPGGRLKLSGYTATRLEKVSLTREARAVDRSVLIQVSADEDLEELAREALALFPDAGAELVGVHNGRIALKGRVATGALHEQIVAALRDGVPGLRDLDDQLIAEDTALERLGELLARDGLTGRIGGHLNGSRLVVDGTPDAADREAWRKVRGELAARFGESFEIVENFGTPVSVAPTSLPSAPASSWPEHDVVAAVMGPMPYVLLRDGTKMAVSADASTR